MKASKFARFAIIAISLSASALSKGSAPASQKPALRWEPWSDSAFAMARQQHKFVLLDLEAVWCHWCHVMYDITYADPDVMRLLQKKYILVRVDQDSRPDISNRYQDYGWPATVVFASDGSEIVKRQGFIQPAAMASMLQAIIDDPSPGPSIEKKLALHPPADASISPNLLTKVKQNYEAQYDKNADGWSFGHKYLDEESMEYALRLAAGGDALYQRRTTATLHNAMALVDPVWGGAYQYSVDGKWSEPHFEKLISIQSSFIREYSLAYSQTQKAEYLTTAQAVHNYVRDFLTDKVTGAFFVSQDADLHDGEDNEPYFKLNDKKRRALGMPRIDTHIYARENGEMIVALCDLYAVSGDASALNEAQRAANWVAHHRSLPDGGFRHDQESTAGLYLADTLSMGQAFLAMYIVAGDRSDLNAAKDAAGFIQKHFAPAAPGTGYVTAIPQRSTITKSLSDRSENVMLVRFASMLAFATQDARYHTMGAEAMRYLATPAIALRPLSAGTLLAHQDFLDAPLHVTILGGFSDPQAQALHTAALRALTSHELIEWRDPAANNSLPTAVSYPKLNRAALFLCTAQACSTPIFHPEDVAAKIQRAQLHH